MGQIPAIYLVKSAVRFLQDIPNERVFKHVEQLLLVVIDECLVWRFLTPVLHIQDLLHFIETDGPTWHNCQLWLTLRVLLFVGLFEG